MFKSITLEMSLKPFKQTDDAFIEKICKGVFEQWRPYIKDRKTISVMLWTADGSEILDYTGNLDQEFEWCYLLGNANMPMLKEDEPISSNLHAKAQIYMENPPKMTYRILKKIVDTLKYEGKRQFPDAEILIGETFDIGPEFAISDFKYNRHHEVCKGIGCDALGFVDCTALLKADNYPYAAYPDGLPENTPMGTLLGKQTNIFFKDMGFDYIWLSNGMGFSYTPWDKVGKIFDGKQFYPEKLSATKEKVVLFWKYFREACPDIPIHTRGTNHSVGIDYATDGVPLYDIYNGNFNITPPPNSPWAAINDDIGIEILGQLTRNCELPQNDYMFRYYLHDIWWMNSPWYDRYEQNPYDIYIPMALSRIDENGDVQPPTLMNILAIDNSMGGMPDCCANEVMPHLLKAEKDAPDEPSPVVMVYPMREYTTNQGDLLSEMYYGDTFLQKALNNGFPLATAVSTDNFAKHPIEVYKKSVLLVPAGFDNHTAKEKLAEFAQNGGKIIVYGSCEKLEKVDFDCKKVDISGDTDKLMQALSEFGWSIKFKTLKPEIKLPAITIHRNDNATYFSVYNRNTTTETYLKTPLGAPILNGLDTRLSDGYSVYTFSRSEHRECRVFVKQKEGILRSREMPVANRKYRRKIQITGLENAEVFLFAEDYCKTAAAVGGYEFRNDNDMNTPQDFWEVINDPENGCYLHAKNVSGTIYLAMPFPDQM
ncbi:MAG: hypothetical protein IKB45_00175 [Clostridia bacterium]|nr:hypothetical protein [Clostridia bacterium]